MLTLTYCHRRQVCTTCNVWQCHQAHKYIHAQCHPCANVSATCTPAWKGCQSHGGAWHPLAHCCNKCTRKILQCILYQSLNICIFTWPLRMPLELATQCQSMHHLWAQVHAPSDVSVILHKSCKQSCCSLAAAAALIKAIKG